jgi:hypothetical protein
LVLALSVYHGDLFAGGYFQSAGDVPCFHIARWNGSQWGPLGSGMGGSTGYNEVHALTVYAGELIAGGGFQTAGGTESYHWARWACPRQPGDLNCDGLVNDFDITPFVKTITNPSQYEQLYPDCNIFNADINGDGAVNNFDITPFVHLLTGQ